MHRLVRPEFSLLFLGLLAGACSNDTVTTPTTTTTPAVITDTFSGTLTLNGAATYPFAVPLAGTITAKLTSVTPDNTVLVGFALGTWNGTSCQLVLTNDKALEGATVIGAASGPGNLCVRVYDVGNLVSPASYQVNVIHP